MRLWTKNVLGAKLSDAGGMERFLGLLREVAVKRGVPETSLPSVSTWVEAIELEEGRL